ncbi:uncharacterized protein B0H18DRAFT_1005167 [Fomitopsis serialis]|uniref:uncharacterized protein n=1 Tax=Fomitopsis serialis TaxID=139415 RepID=UPI002007887C|nr:uncharacterized protein B0H18DRAFT_1005167 [Neoantrodia serialis]KAH9926699.1 hypothetical protein B0H18DRAFT_1005167 [Neoantrodia serialis]
MPQDRANACFSAPVYGGAVINDRSTLVSASDDGSPHSQRNYNPSSRSAQVDPLTSFRSGHNAPDPCHPATAPNLKPPPGVFTVPCRWGHCGISLDDGSAGGMKRHLHGFHEGDMKKGMPCVCKWMAEDGTPCQKHYANEVTLTRHIATVHLKSSAENCPHCGMHMSRKDALNRHIQASCRVANLPV